jgi:hypothetical protein
MTYLSAPLGPGIYGVKIGIISELLWPPYFDRLPPPQFLTDFNVQNRFGDLSTRLTFLYSLLDPGFARKSDSYVWRPAPDRRVHLMDEGILVDTLPYRSDSTLPLRLAKTRRLYPSTERISEVVFATF